MCSILYKFSLLCVFVILLQDLIRVTASTLAESLISMDELNLTTLELIKLRGFNATNHNLTTSDGYILNLVRCTNPLINYSNLNNKDVILFVHGTDSNANFYIVNSLGAHPIDHSQMDLNSRTQEELIEIFKDDPNKNSLPFLSLNAGHEVWLLNRRGTYQSKRHVDNEKISEGILHSIFRSSMEQKYWNYTFDDEISKDIPETIDYVLKLTGRRKLAYVGQSSGGAILLASMSHLPELNDKVSVALLWSPSIYVTKSSLSISEFIKYQALKNYIGPLPPLWIVPTRRRFVALICQTPLLQEAICSRLADGVSGPSGNQQRLLPGFAGSMDEATSTRQLLHLHQAFSTGKLHQFNFGKRRSNLIAYGEHEPPVYNVSKITNTKLVLFSGSTDKTVPIDRTKELIKDLSVKPAQVVFIDQPGIFFNHKSYVWHKDIAKLVNIPGLKALSTFGGSSV